MVCPSSALYTIAGTILGGFIGYFSAHRLAIIRAKIEAGVKLRSAFAPELAEVRLALSGQERDIKQLLINAFARHAAAIEEFSFYVPDKDKEAYYKAWNNYAGTAGGTLNFLRYWLGPDPYNEFIKDIHTILRFTE